MPNCKEQNNIIYVEPNYNYSKEEYDVNGLNTHEFIPPAEDYCIYTNLEVEVRGRRINASTDSPTKLVLSWESTSDKTTVNFMQGTKMPGDNVNYFTTNYTDTFLGDIKSKGPSTEMFGISSIDISYNNYMQPVVTIEFIDVRGVSLFAQRAYYETATHGSDIAVQDDTSNVANSFFQCFFTTPFPKFNLIVKGFYGKAISYQLLCSDFRARFKAEEGSFSCTAKFIGYHFAFLGDVMMNAIVAAPYSDYIGRDYWKDRHFTIPSYDGGTTEMPTMPVLLSRLKQVQGDVQRMSEAMPEVQELQQAQETLETSSDIRTAYNDYMSAVLPKIKEKVKAINASVTTDIETAISTEDNSKFGCILLPTTGNTEFIALGRALDMLDYSNTQDADSEYSKLYVLKKDYSDIEEKRKRFFTALKNNSKFSDQLEQCDILLCKRQNLSDITKSISKSDTEGYDDFFAKANKLAVSTSTLSSVRKFYYFNSPVAKWLKEENAEDRHEQESKIEELQQQVEETINNYTTEALKFIPSVENFTKIVMAHFETFAYMLLQCGLDIVGENRTVSSLGQLTVDDLSDVDTEKTEQIVPPFPRLTEIVEKNGQRSREESWVGRDGLGYFREKDLVHGILNGIREVERVINEQSNDERVGTETGTHEYSLVPHPLTVYDLVVPNNIYENVDFNDTASFLSLIAVRAIDILYTDYGSDKQHPVDPKTLGSVEAVNLLTKNQIPQDVIDKLKGLSGNADTVIEMLLGKSTDAIPKPNGGSGPWPWNTDASSNEGMLKENSGSNMYYNLVKDKNIKSHDTYLLPYTQLSWSSIIGNLVQGNFEKAYASDNFLDTFNDESKINSVEKIKQNLFTIELGMSNVAGIIDNQVTKMEGLDEYGQTLSKQAKHDRNIYENYVDVGNLKKLVVSFYEKPGEVQPKAGESILPYKSTTIKFEEDGKEIFYFDGGKNLNDLHDLGEVATKKTKDNTEGTTERKFEDAYNNYLDNINTNDYVLIEFPFVNEHFEIEDSVDSFLGRSAPLLSCFGSIFYYMQENIYAKAFLFLSGLGYYINYKDICQALADKEKMILNVPLPGIIYAGGVMYFFEDEKTYHFYSDKTLHDCCEYDSTPVQSYLYLKQLHPEVKKNLKNIFKEWVNGPRITWTEASTIKPFSSYNKLLELQLKNTYDKGVITFLSNLGEMEDYKSNGSGWIEQRDIFKGKGYGGNLMKMLCGELQDNFFNNYYSIDEDSKNGALFGVFGGMRLANREGGLGIIPSCHFALAGCTFVKHGRFFVENSESKFELYPSKAHLGDFFEGFIERIISDVNVETQQSNAIAMAAEPTNTTEDIKVGVYRYCKLLYDKWISYLSSVEEFKANYSIEKFFDYDDRYFVFIDTYYNKANDKIMNLGHFAEEIKGCFKRTQYSLLSFLSEEYAYNKFSFNCVNNFLDLNNRNNIKSMFDLVPLSLMGNPKDHPNFVVMLCNEPSTHLDIPDADYPDDSFDISNFDDMSKWPEPLKARNEGVYDGYIVPSFGVTYGKQYQSYFQNVEVGMDNPMITEQSIKAQWEIASAANADSNTGDRANTVYYGQDLYSVFSNYSYTCTVTMLGCAFIQPLMYFCLNNIPMFRGTYIIQRVQHTITPGNMITKFIGTRMANVSTRRVKEYMVRVAATGGMGDQITPENRLANIDNDCNYKVYPLYDNSALGGDVGDIASMQLSPNGEMENAKLVVAAFVSMGYSDVAGAAVAGNIYVETHFAPNVVNKMIPATHTKGLKGGVCQWQGVRLPHLVKWTTEGNEIYDVGQAQPMPPFGKQLLFIIKECKEVSAYKGALDALLSATSDDKLDETTEIFRRIYEGGSEPEKRKKYARDVLKAYRENPPVKKPVQIANMGSSTSSNSSVSTQSGAKIGCCGDSWMQHMYEIGHLDSKLKAKGYQPFGVKATKHGAANSTYLSGSQARHLKNYVKYALSQGCTTILINNGINDCFDTSWFEEIGNLCGNAKVYFIGIPYDLKATPGSSKCTTLNDNRVIGAFDDKLSEVCRQHGWNFIDLRNVNPPLKCSGFHLNPNSEKERAAQYVADAISGAGGVSSIGGPNGGVATNVDLATAFVNALDKTLATTSIGVKIGVDGKNSKSDAVWLTNSNNSANFDIVLDVMLKAYSNVIESIAIIVQNDTKEVPVAYSCSLKENSNSTVVGFVKKDGLVRFCENGAIKDINSLSEHFTKAIYKKYGDNKALIRKDVWQLSDEVVDAIIKKHGPSGESKITPCSDLLKTETPTVGGEGGSVTLADGGTIVNGMINGWNVQKFVERLYYWQKYICCFGNGCAYHRSRGTYGGCHYCTGVINRALIDTGYPSLVGGEPYLLYDHLKKSPDFVEVDSGTTNLATSVGHELEFHIKLQAGDICTMWTCRGNCKGFKRHTCAYDGKQWISDYYQKKAAAYSWVTLEWHVMRKA